MKDQQTLADIGIADDSFRFRPTWRRQHEQYRRCLAAVFNCLNSDPVSKFLYNAIKSQGCAVPVIDCKICTDGYSWYDYEHDEISICMNQNKSISRNSVCSQLNHKLIHAFDNCRAKVNPKSLSHMACAEIRAVNLTDCICVSEAKWRTLANSHKDCVRNKVLEIFDTKEIPQDRIKAAVDKVFDRCYNDLEPTGRRIRQFSKDPCIILLEGFYAGYMKKK